MVSDWHILPILDTSFASFLVQVQGWSRKNFLKRATPALALNFSAKTGMREQQTKTINR